MNRFERKGEDVEEKTTSARRMRKKQIAITLGAMCFALTLAVSIQLKTVQNSNSTIAQSLKENGLRDEVLKWKERYENMYEELTQSTKTLEEIRKQATQDDEVAKRKQEEITQNNMLLGMTNVTGPGLEITLADNTSRTKSRWKRSH